MKRSMPSLAGLNEGLRGSEDSGWMPTRGRLECSRASLGAGGVSISTSPKRTSTAFAIMPNWFRHDGTPIGHSEACGQSSGHGWLQLGVR
jgi:hypothetical protein